MAGIDDSTGKLIQSNLELKDGVNRLTEYMRSQEDGEAFDEAAMAIKIAKENKLQNESNNKNSKKGLEKLAQQANWVKQLLKDTREQARSDAGDKLEELNAKKRADKKEANEENSEGGKFSKLINYFKKDAKESKTEFGNRLFGFFGKFALGIGAIVLFLKNWKGIIRPFIKGFVETLFPKLDETLKNLYKSIDESFTKLFGKDIGTTITEMKKNVMTLVSSFSSILEFFGMKTEKPEGMEDRDFYNTLTPGKFAPATEVFGDKVNFAFANRYAKAMSPEGNKEVEERLLKKEEEKDKKARAIIRDARIGLALPELIGVNNHDKNRRRIKAAEEILRSPTLLSQHRSKLFNDFLSDEGERAQLKHLKNTLPSYMYAPGMQNRQQAREKGINFAENAKIGFDIGATIVALSAVNQLPLTTQQRGRLFMQMGGLLKNNKFKSPGEGAGTVSLNTDDFSADNFTSSFFANQDFYPRPDGMTKGLEASEALKTRRLERTARLTPQFGPAERALGSNMPAAVVTDASVINNNSRLEMVSKVIFSENNEYEDIP